jgi:hypothetical protein
MIASAEILKELYKSMVKGSMLGLFIKNDSKASFIITRIKKIADDPSDPENKLVSLPENDIHGNVILTNPIMSKNIIDIRDFNRLRGIDTHSSK